MVKYNCPAPLLRWKIGLLSILLLKLHRWFSFNVCMIIQLTKTSAPLAPPVLGNDTSVTSCRAAIGPRPGDQGGPLLCERDRSRFTAPRSRFGNKVELNRSNGTRLGRASRRRASAPASSVGSSTGEQAPPPKLSPFEMKPFHPRVKAGVKDVEQEACRGRGLSRLASLLGDTAGGAGRPWPPPTVVALLAMCPGCGRRGAFRRRLASPCGWLARCRPPARRPAAV